MGNAEYMGSPRQTFAGETRPAVPCRWPRAAKGWSASQKRYILTFRNSLDPASLLKTKRRRIRTQRSQDCLPSENIYRRQKHPPHPKTPRNLPLGCRPFDDCLSRCTLQETETFEEGEEDLKPSFTF